MTNQANVTVVRLSDTGQVLRFQKNRIVVGSVVSANVKLSGEGVAPIHAVIEINPDSKNGKNVATIYDIDSESGVYVNGQKVITASIHLGDQIKIGPHIIEIAVEDIKNTASLPIRQTGEKKLFLNPEEDITPILLESDEPIEEIFDYRDSYKTALEVVMSWRETILDVEHFVSQKTVSLGSSRKSDFIIPPLLSSSYFRLITQEPEGFVINLDPKMEGVIQRDGVLQKINQLKEKRILLKGKDYSKISIGEIDFYISFTSAPPHVKNQKIIERDPFYFKILVSSLLFTTALITTLLNIKVPQVVEVEQVPERIATILYQPEKYSSFSRPVVRADSTKADVAKPLPSPKKTVKIDIQPNMNNINKPIPKEIDLGKQQAKPVARKESKQSQRQQSQGKEGQGARAKGEEGTRGTRQARAGKDHQQVAQRPSPSGGSGAGGGKSQMRDEGNIDFLKGASEKILNLLGNSGERLGKDGSRLQGFGGFDTRGSGGLALGGGGKGGGGDAASLGGLSDRGRGGGRVGTGMGAAGTGSSLVGGRSRVILRTGGSEETVILGSIDASAIEAALLAHRDEFKLCYEREINAGHPKLAGRVSTSFVIGSSGRVTQSGIASSSLKSPNAERCILEVIRRIEFPIPKGGGVVQVTYPFKFSPVGT